MIWNKIIFFIFIFILVVPFIYAEEEFKIDYSKIETSTKNVTFSNMMSDKCFMQNTKGNYILDHGCFIENYGNIMTKETKQFGINVLIVQVITFLFSLFFKNHKNKIVRETAESIYLVDYVLLNLFVLYIIFVL